MEPRLSALEWKSLRLKACLARSLASALACSLTDVQGLRK